MKILLMFFLFSATISAQTWEYWGTYKTKKVFINPKLTQKFGQIVQITINDTAKSKSSYARLAFDCQNQGVMQIKVKNSKKIWQSWDNFYQIAPNTYGEWLYKKACNL